MICFLPTKTRTGFNEAHMFHFEIMLVTHIVIFHDASLSKPGEEFAHGFKWQRFKIQLADCTRVSYLNFVRMHGDFRLFLPPFCRRECVSPLWVINDPCQRQISVNLRKQPKTYISVSTKSDKKRFICKLEQLRLRLARYFIPPQEKPSQSQPRSCISSILHFHLNRGQPKKRQRCRWHLFLRDLRLFESCPSCPLGFCSSHHQLFTQVSWYSSNL